VDTIPGDKYWPSVPAELKYIEFRLPGTFRELVANKTFTNEEIGRIVRCLAMDSDFFITPHIEPEVFFYRKGLIKRDQTRRRVEALRSRRKMNTSGGALSASIRRGDCVTVTQQAEKHEDPGAVGGEDILSSEKTSPVPKEKTPPIVPLERNPPFPLEKPAAHRKGRTKKDAIVDSIQSDLFDLATSSVGGDRRAEPQETGQGGAKERAAGPGGTTTPPGRPDDSRGIYDSRDDAAWIPQQFAVFWEQYPRKVAKGDARKAFAKIIKKQGDVDKFMSMLLASLAWWKSQPGWVKDNGKFIPYPATWLNRGSWEDAKENGGVQEQAQFLKGSESEDELIRRMMEGS